MQVELAGDAEGAYGAVQLGYCALRQSRRLVGLPEDFAFVYLIGDGEIFEQRRLIGVRRTQRRFDLDPACGWAGYDGTTLGQNVAPGGIGKRRFGVGRTGPEFERGSRRQTAGMNEIAPTSSVSA